MIRIKKIFIIVLAALCFLWNLILSVFLIGSDSGAAAAMCAAAGVAGSGLAYMCIRFLSDRFLPLDAQKRRLIFTLGAFSVCLAIMLCTPYSPAHDSHDMSVFLSTFVRDTTLSDYADKYLSFYGTNRVCMYFYKPLVELFRSVRVGSVISNIIFLLTTVFCVSDIIYRRYGVRSGEVALFLLPPFVPYMMMSGPYIYPPAVFLSAVALCLYFSGDVRRKVLSSVFFGGLMLMRPTSAMFWIIFMVAQLVLKKNRDIISKICFVTVLVLISMCTKTATEGYMYKTGSYPFPGFANSAMQWTLELGLRPQGTETGKCTYSAISGEAFDEISSVFVDLWEAYDGADDNETYRIHCLNKQLDGLIRERAARTVFSDAASLFGHIKTKYINMFSDEYKAYYYSVNIADENFAENAYKNYEWRYFLSENVILISFAFACLILCASVILNVWKGRRCPSVMLGAALSVMAVLCGFVLLTEVGKRLIFDLYVPMCIVMCTVYAHVINSVRMRIKHTPVNVALCGVACVLLISIVQLFYSLYNAKPFADCMISYTSGDNAVITLDEMNEEEGYYLWYPDGENVSLLGRQNVTLPLEKNDRMTFEIILPSGQIIVVTNYEQR